LFIPCIVDNQFVTLKKRKIPKEKYCALCWLGITKVRNVAEEIKRKRKSTEESSNTPQKVREVAGKILTETQQPGASNRGTTKDPVAESITDLPPELLLHVSWLNKRDLSQNVSCVCKKWFALAKDPYKLFLIYT
jgi:hypothetical protein